MRQEIRSKLKERRDTEMREQLAKAIATVEAEGYTVTFGEIGQKTTYAMLARGEEEIVGYTFIKDLNFKNELVGKYKALQQAMTRKSLLAQQSAEGQEA